jgi:hypothetical protein
MSHAFFFAFSPKTTTASVLLCLIDPEQLRRNGNSMIGKEIYRIGDNR